MGLHTADTAVPEISPAAQAVSRGYAWLVFALSFGLLLSDYMSRQVLNSVFPLLKAEWLLSDGQLGSLSSIVALMVGLLTFPLSLVADRWGRVRSLVLSAVVWSLATLGCAVSASFGEMFAARFIVGVGEAAYGSVGIAVVLSVFPIRLRATLSAAFIAGGSFGSVLGVSAGGVIAQEHGWRWAFSAMGIFGLVLATVYGLVVTEKRLGTASNKHSTKAGERAPLRTLLPRLFSSVSVVCAYIGSGLQMFIAMAMLAWMPSFFNRYYSMAPAKAGLAAGVLALLSGTGMILCGIAADRLSRNLAARKWTVAISCSLASLVLLMVGFRLPTGPVQLVLIGAGTLVACGTAGPAAAMVANLTPAAIAATAMATLTLANSLLGLAPGPAVTGMLADDLGLRGALQLVPLVAVLSGMAFVVGKLSYEKDLHRLGLLPGVVLTTPEPQS
ncbi:MFS transporter [Streptomyces sp. NBC_00873]|uniref:MFS transporter n=1 Tax=unclassified Streptomyces TaxID=2593676 RepID=UPI00386A9906|nr:MFS transporter [Streptomyces sp. NBC_00873]WTA48137.1 MFS transporter [Streptomyces sp. NBC_00842]